ncbi:hypothetical protein F5877DRAFT_84562 [Lentinula edodes]|nr:hypothetical protein F5877DRAFT_84562 [Lentinula edodes]
MSELSYRHQRFGRPSLSRSSNDLVVPPTAANGKEVPLKALNGVALANKVIVAVGDELDVDAFKPNPKPGFSSSVSSLRKVTTCSRFDREAEGSTISESGEDGMVDDPGAD